LRKLRVLVFGGFVVLALIVATVSNYYFQTFQPVLVLMVLWIPVYLVLGYPFVYWRCPRCNRPFSGSFGYHKECSAGLASTAGSASIRTAGIQKISGRRTNCCKDEA
jgi:hypothetical protein